MSLSPFRICMAIPTGLLVAFGAAHAQEAPAPRKAPAGIGMSVSKSIADTVAAAEPKAKAATPARARKAAKRKTLAHAQPVDAEQATELAARDTTEVAQTIPAGADDVHKLVRLYAQRHGVPASLAHRVVMRESRYNPRLKGRAHYGLLQISLPTARQMGYAGAPAGLFDAKTNLAYGMPYLANAWLVSGGNESRAVSLYSRGYYYEAKRKGLLRSLRTASSAPDDPRRSAEVLASE